MAKIPAMPFNQYKFERKDDDDSSTYTIRTPPETVVADHPDGRDPLGGAGACPYLGPWPKSTFIIRSVSSGHVLTLQDGKVALTRAGGRGSIHWVCVETKGWLGFRNTVSGKFLGHDEQGRLRCSAEKHLGWENFCVRGKPEGGCILLMQHFDRLWHVGNKVEQGVKILAKIGEGSAGGMAFEFLKV